MARADLMARFPNGVPAISDEQMSAWMKYVCMQFERPANAVGVLLTIDVIDSNGNYRNIGTVTSDSSDFFKFMWTARAGSKPYWPSFAETAFCIDEALAPTPVPASEPLTLPAFDMYIAAVT